MEPRRMQMTEPLEIKISVQLESTELLTEADLYEIRRLADGSLDDDQVLSDLVNECVESKLDFYRMEFVDFDWDGQTWETILNAVRGLDPNGEPFPIPEIPGQVRIDDILSEMV
jgi:hypothetical protein